MTESARSARSGGRNGPRLAAQQEPTPELCRTAFPVCRMRSDSLRKIETNKPRIAESRDSQAQKARSQARHSPVSPKRNAGDRRRRRGRTNQGEAQGADSACETHPRDERSHASRSGPDARRRTPSAAPVEQPEPRREPNTRAIASGADGVGTSATQPTVVVGEGARTKVRRREWIPPAKPTHEASVLTRRGSAPTRGDELQARPQLKQSEPRRELNTRAKARGADGVGTNEE